MIHLLDIHTANLIAAGEVVDRPSSAIKELVENSIDAKAASVVIEIKNGGISYIRVADNGEGMDAGDLGRSVLRHATSKIKDENDLDKITTLGFRGEALAAISSVSDLKIFTRIKDAQTGYMLESSGGQNIKISETGCAAGTTVIIENLFSKIPARRKFLKRDMTEGMYCRWTAEKTALSNPHVSLKFINDGIQKLFTPGNGNYKDTIYSVFGGETAENLISFGDFDAIPDENEIVVYGFVSKIENGQKTRAGENFFVNGRYIYSKTVMSALEEAYKSISETGMFPVSALYIKIDESKIDINVHPQKMEIKFSDEKKIYSAVYYAVRSALEESSANKYNDFILTPIQKPSEAPSQKYETSKTYKSKYFENIESIVSENIENIKNIENIENIENINGEYKKDDKTYQYREYNRDEKPVINKNYKIIGEAFYGYIFVEKEEKIVIIDKHAAHERIIYDIILKKDTQTQNQILLVPIEIKLDPKEAAGIFEIKKDIEKFGIIFEFLNGETLIISEIPAELAGLDIEGIIKEAAYMHSEDDSAVRGGIFEKLADLSAKKSAACRAAMKSGIADSPENIEWLTDRVMNYENIGYCPHGRPVAFEIKKSDIEKNFKR